MKRNEQLIPLECAFDLDDVDDKNCSRLSKQSGKGANEKPFFDRNGDSLSKKQVRKPRLHAGRYTACGTERTFGNFLCSAGSCGIPNGGYQAYRRT